MTEQLTQEQIANMLARLDEIESVLVGKKHFHETGLNGGVHKNEMFLCRGEISWMVRLMRALQQKARYFDWIVEQKGVSIIQTHPDDHPSLFDTGCGCCGARIADGATLAEAFEAAMKED